MTKRSTSLLFKSLLILSATALITTSFIPSSNRVIEPMASNQTEEIRRLDRKEMMVPDYREVAKKAIPAVVSIKVQTRKKSPLFGSESEDPLDLFGNDFWEFFSSPKRESKIEPLVGQASGVIVDPRGYILTNSHVVHNMDSIQVQLADRREFPAKVLGEDTNSDIAVIKIDAQDLPYLTLGNSDELEVGQWVAAIGNPFGLQATLTSGVVSAKSRNNLDIVREEDFIQTDAAINRGNSGGPLLTLDGEVIGINTAIATTSTSGYMGIGFAIPSNMAKRVLDDIISNGKVSRGLLGINLQSIDYQLAQAFGLSKVEGALVSNVIKGSPADHAGLQIEDIILRYNGRPVENAAQLRNAVYMMKPGSEIILTVLRKDQTLEIPVTVGDFSESAEHGAITQKNQLGIEVESLTPELARNLGYTNEQGVVITRVSPSSVAALAGLKKGALILAVNRQKVTNVSEFNQALAETAENKPILLQIKQGDLHLFISLQSQNAP
jgi:serine protease Do